MPVEYNLMTCFPKVFPVFSPFSLNSRCLYSVYALFITSSLALSTLSCVHLPKECLWHSLILLALILTLVYVTQCVPLVYQQHNLKTHHRLIYLSTPAIIFMKCRNCQHMKNNIRYKGNINNFSVITF